MLTRATPTEFAAIESPTKATHGHSLDKVIRGWGYTIAQRPANGTPTWAKRGIRFSQNDVLLREGKTQ